MFIDLGRCIIAYQNERTMQTVPTTITPEFERYMRSRKNLQRRIAEMTPEEREEYEEAEYDKAYREDPPQRHQA